MRLILVAPLLAPGAGVLIVAGDQARTGEAPLGFPDPTGPLAAALLAHHGAEYVRTTVVGDERTAVAMAAAIAARSVDATRLRAEIVLGMRRRLTPDSRQATDFPTPRNQQIRAA
jgi:hypothetical protein